VGFYLSNDKQNKFSLEDFEIDKIQNQIIALIDEMQVLLDDPRANIASENRFSFSKNEQICKYCNFLKI